VEKVLENLNEMQQKAVLTTEGPVMAIAGAGSGKTSVLTRRIAHLIENLGIPHENILAITFTNKAAQEMKERIGALLKISTRNMWISTFHSMCARILREHSELLGYDKHFQIIDDDDTLQMIKSIMKQANMDIKLINPNQLKTHLLNVKQDPNLIEAYQEPLKEYLRKIYPIYQKKLKENNLMDFEDLLLLTIELLKNYENVRNHFHKMFQYVLVDEFQDTNNVQYNLIKLLVNRNQNVFIVGDEDQSIYAFRGANIQNIKNFSKDYNDVETILLEQNYRSTNTILDAANQIIKGNKNRIKKNLYSTKGDGEKITFFKAYSGRDEVEYVAETIRSLSRNGYGYKDIAVLYRANSMSRLFEEVFMQKQLPYKIYGNTSFFKRKEIKDMVAYLRLIINPHDNYAYMRVVNEPKRGIGAKTVDTLSVHAEEAGISLYDMVNDANNPLKPSPSKKLKAFNALLDLLSSHFDQLDFNQFIDDLLDKTGYFEALKSDDKGDVRYENILELKTMLKESEKTYLEADKRELLMYVLEDIALKSQEEQEEDYEGVALMTLHAAKGLEFKVVFIVGVEQGMFPLYRSLDNAKEIEEERRLMYVGVTRAEELLYFTNAKQRQHYGDLVMHPDSMFIKEIKPELLKLEGLNREREQTSSRYTQEYRQTKTFKAKQSNLKNYKQNDLNKGDKVEHKAFGVGVVVSVVKDQCVIAFSKEHGLKTLMKDHPAIKKL